MAFESSVLALRYSSSSLVELLEHDVAGRIAVRSNTRQNAMIRTKRMHALICLPCFLIAAPNIRAGESGERDLIFFEQIVDAYLEQFDGKCIRSSNVRLRGEGEVAWALINEKVILEPPANVIEFTFAPVKGGRIRIKSLDGKSVFNIDWNEDEYRTLATGDSATLCDIKHSVMGNVPSLPSNWHWASFLSNFRSGLHQWSDTHLVQIDGMFVLETSSLPGSVHKIASSVDNGFQVHEIMEDSKKSTGWTHIIQYKNDRVNDTWQPKNFSVRKELNGEIIADYSGEFVEPFQWDTDDSLGVMPKIPSGTTVSRFLDAVWVEGERKERTRNLDSMAASLRQMVLSGDDASLATPNRRRSTVRAYWMVFGLAAVMVGGFGFWFYRRR